MNPGDGPRSVPGDGNEASRVAPCDRCGTERNPAELCPACGARPTDTRSEPLGSVPVVTRSNATRGSDSTGPDGSQRPAPIPTGQGQPVPTDRRRVPTWVVAAIALLALVGAGLTVVALGGSGRGADDAGTSAAPGGRTSDSSSDAPAGGGTGSGRSVVGGGDRLDGYLVLDDEGVDVVSRDGRTQTTVIDHPVAAVFDDGAGGLVYQELRTVPGALTAAGTPTSSGIGLLLDPPATQGEGSIWHLPAGAVDPEPVVEPNQEAGTWPILAGAGSLDGAPIVVYGAPRSDPGLEGCCYADLVVRDLATGTDTMVGPQSWWAADGSVDRVSVTDDYLAWTAYGAWPLWHVVGTDLDPAPVPCNGVEEVGISCAGYSGVLDSGGRLISLDTAATPYALQTVTMATNELTGTAVPLDRPEVSDQRYHVYLDASADEVVVSYLPFDGAPDVPASSYERDGDGTLVTLDVSGEVHILRAPLERPTGAKPLGRPGDR